MWVVSKIPVSINAIWEVGCPRGTNGEIKARNLGRGGGRTIGLQVDCGVSKKLHIPMNTPINTSMVPTLVKTSVILAQLAS